MVKLKMFFCCFTTTIYIYIYDIMICVHIYIYMFITTMTYWLCGMKMRNLNPFFRSAKVFTRCEQKWCVGKSPQWPAANFINLFQHTTASRHINHISDVMTCKSYCYHHMSYLHDILFWFFIMTIHYHIFIVSSW